MKLKEFLKPTLGKVIFSFAITILWIWLGIRQTGFYGCVARACSYEDYSRYLIVPEPCTSCITFATLISNYLVYLILPFALSYFFYSILSIFIFTKK